MEYSEKRVVLQDDIAQRLIENTRVTDENIAKEIARRWVRSA